MKKLLAGGLLAALLAAASLASAQENIVRTLPSVRTSTNASGTIAATGVFQQLLPSNTNRTGCTIQNTGTNPMYVYFGTTATATTAKSVKLAAGQAAYCTSGDGIVVNMPVQITGTISETFYLNYW